MKRKFLIVFLISLFMVFVVNATAFADEEEPKVMPDSCEITENRDTIKQEDCKETSENDLQKKREESEIEDDSQNLTILEKETVDMSEQNSVSEESVEVTADEEQKESEENACISEKQIPDTEIKAEKKESNYLITITDSNGNSVDIPGGKETNIADILKGLGIEVAEDTEISVDYDSVDTNVVDVTETEDGRLVLTDKGHFEKAVKNLIVYIDGTQVELTVTDDYNWYVDAESGVDEGNEDGGMSAPYKTVQYAVTKAGAEKTNITLKTNIIEDITITSGQDITLDLNGKVMKGTGTASVIRVKPGASLSILDSEPTVIHHFSEDENGLWIWDPTETATEHIVCGGIITGGNAKTGGGLAVSSYTKDSYASVKVIGGSIVGNTAISGAGINVSYGTLTLNKTNILGNFACTRPGYGGGIGGGINIVTYGNVTMNGGKIAYNQGNSAYMGGAGLYVSNNTSYFTMNDGIITDNHTKHGLYQGIFNYGTVQINGGTINDDITNANNQGDTKFKMTGGTLNNKLQVAVGSIGFLEDGTINGNVEVSGNFTMTGGTVNGDMNLTQYWSKPAELTMDGGRINGSLTNGYDTNSIGIKSGLLGNAPENIPDEWIADGSKVDAICKGTYASYIGPVSSVVADYDTGKSYDSFEAAVLDDASNLFIIEDITDSVLIPSGKTISLDLNGKFIEGNIEAADNSSLVILNSNTSDGGIDGVISKNDNASILVKGGIYSNQPDASMIASGYMLTENTDESTKNIYPYRVVAKPNTPSFPSSGYTDEKVIVPVQDGGTLPIEAKVNGDKAVIDELSKDDIDSIASSKGSTGTLTIDCSATGSDISKVEMKKQNVKDIAESNEKELKVIMNSGSITFDKTAIAAVADSADSDTVVITIEEVEDTALTDEQRKAVAANVSESGNSEILAIVDTYILSGNAKIRVLSGGKARIELNTKSLSNADLTSGTIVVYEIAEDGTMRKIEFQIIDGKIVFDANELSKYIIVRE